MNIGDNNREIGFNNGNSLGFTIGAGSRLMLFLCVTALGVVLAGVVMAIITHGGNTPARLRIATVFQSLLMFIVPALATAVICCRRPASFLQIDRRPALVLNLLAISVIVAGIPMINLLVKINSAMQLPESFAGVEQWMRDAEAAAAEYTQTLIGGHTTSGFIIAILIVGVLAALGEELFFRGTLQRLLVTAGIGGHLAVWATAIIFSAVHMQFFGFFPRLLLGAMFGYIVLWSGNLWLGIFAHFTNNAIAAATMVYYPEAALPVPGPVESQEVIFAGGSLCVTLLLLVMIKRVSRNAFG